MCRDIYPLNVKPSKYKNKSNTDSVVVGYISQSPLDGGIVDEKA